MTDSFAHALQDPAVTQIARKFNIDLADPNTQNELRKLIIESCRTTDFRIDDRIESQVAPTDRVCFTRKDR